MKQAGQEQNRKMRSEKAPRVVQHYGSQEMQSFYEQEKLAGCEVV